MTRTRCASTASCLCCSLTTAHHHGYDSLSPHRTGQRYVQHFKSPAACQNDSTTAALLRATNASACVLAEPRSSSSSASRRADVYQTCLGTARRVLHNTSLDKSVPAGGYLCLSLHNCCAESCHSSSPKRKQTVLPSPCRTKDAPLAQHPSQVCPLSCCSYKGIPSASLRSKAKTPKSTPTTTRWTRERVSVRCVCRRAAILARQVGRGCQQPRASPRCCCQPTAPLSVEPTHIHL